MITAILAIVMFAVLIFIHELGHFAAAKACGVKVNRFALGMGPAIFRRQRGETEYSLRIFPIGGFCEMEGEDEDSEDSRAFNKKTAWQKAVILVAGPFMNFLLALVLMIFISFQLGAATTTVAEVMEGSPAQEAGILAGDEILSVNGENIEQWAQVSEAVSSSDREMQQVVVLRDGEELTMESGTMESGDRQILGLTPAVEKNFLVALKNGPSATMSLTKEMYAMLKQLLTGQASAKELSGPVGIIYIVNQTAKDGVMNFLYLLALISLNLAVLNLLPFPALDGGRLVFVLLRKITGKRITDRMEAGVNFAGMIVLLTLMLYVTWNDIQRFIAPLF